MLSALDKKIIGLISKDMPLSDSPFAELAYSLGITEGELIKRMRSYKSNGLLRKFSAVINHRKIGFKYNAMVVWNIPDRLAAKAGFMIASFSSVSHCYQRTRQPSWRYNLYAMVHGKTKAECLSVVKKIVKKTGFRDYRVLFSSKEFKKTPVKY